MSESMYMHLDPSEHDPPHTIMDDTGVCDRCGGFTNKLRDISLMSRGKPIRTWMFCDSCRIRTKIEDLLDLVERDLAELKDAK